MRSILALALAALPVAVVAQCPPLVFIFARATTEPPQVAATASDAEWEAAANQVWSRGYGAAGHSIFTNVTSLIPGAVGYPVHYPANFDGCTSENAGITDMIDYMTRTASSCPNTKFAIGGHSQGGVVTVRAIPEMSLALRRKIVAVTTVGSPDCPFQVATKCRSYCNRGDLICTISLSLNRCELAKRETFGDLFDTLDMASIQPPLRPRQVSTADCSGREPAESGHRVEGDLDPHMAYNEDGHYISAAACYIYNKYQASL